MLIQEFAEELNIPEDRIFITSAIDNKNNKKLKDKIVQDCQQSYQSIPSRPENPLIGISGCYLTNELTKGGLIMRLGQNFTVLEKLDILYEAANYIIEKPKNDKSNYRNGAFFERRNQEYNDLQLHNIEVLTQVYLDYFKNAFKENPSKQVLQTKVNKHKLLIDF